MRRLLPLILLVLTSSVFALGGREKAVVIQITGVVRLIGSNPLPQLVISGVDYDWYITAEEDLNKLHKGLHNLYSCPGIISGVTKPMRINRRRMRHLWGTGEVHTGVW